MSYRQKEEKNLKNVKVVLLGDSGVGKTSIVNRYTTNIFENNLLSTAGVGFLSKIINLEDTKETCKLDVIIIF